MKRITIGALVLAAGALGAFGYLSHTVQRADYGWNPNVAVPTFQSNAPRVLIDEAHHNASTAGLTGRYWPFARLLRADGYAVERGTQPLSATALDGVQVLVIANAAGMSKPQFFGINLPVKAEGKRSDPAFTPAEIAAVVAWVERGGSLLLIADHAPYGAASAQLAAAFGVTMHAGFTELENERSDPMQFSRANGRLPTHPIIDGDGVSSAVSCVLTFTGQSLDGPPGSTALLQLPANAIEYVDVGGKLEPRAAGSAQGIALERGQGRVVVLGEAAMITAQVSAGEAFGMSSPDNDNRQFALNLMHWLSRAPAPALAAAHEGDRDER